MKSIIVSRYGPPEVLRQQERTIPQPHPDEVRVRVYASSVTLFDCWMRSSTSPPGFGLVMRMVNGMFRPKQPVLGTEYAGIIHEVGSSVTRFRKGMEVFGFTGMKLGAYAEYICTSADGMLAPKPVNMSFEEAAVIPQGALTALFFLRSAGIRPGQEVAIFGASGGVGTYAIQIAKHFGARVTGICSGGKAELALSLGCDRVIDYQSEDFTRREENFDIIFDTVGKSPFQGSINRLKRNGHYLFATFGVPRLLRILWQKRRSNIEFGPLAVVQEDPSDLGLIKDLVESGAVRPVLDRCYRMESAAAAHRFVESGQKRGQVALAMV